MGHDLQRERKQAHRHTQRCTKPTEMLTEVERNRWLQRETCRAITHTHTHTHTHTQMPTVTQTDAQRHTHACTHTGKHATHKHTGTHRHILTQTHARGAR